MNYGRRFNIMRADYIYDIIKKFGCFSYDCILFDGPWGIGKTYAIDKALEEQENVCSISMFGLQNSQQIYHEVLCQFVLKNNKAGKIAGAATEVLDGISNIWKSVSSVKEVLQSIAREKELFLLLSKGFDSLHIIVIDDLERVSDRINIEEVFGIVEELKKCNNVKIILVANIDELQENNKEIFKKHNEKVIDRIYHITEKPEKINWGEIGIHAGFMQEFLSVHKVKNLRTLKKAQRFYDDVYIVVNQIDNQQFKDEIRLICFAIVVESTDNLYYKQNDNEDDSNKKIFNELHNELLYRILLYLQEVRSSRNLVNILLEYYNNQIVLSTSDIMLEYKIFLQAGNKPNYFKTDDEIRRILPKIEDDIVKATTIGELNRNADEYEIWSETIGEDNAPMLDKYREIVRNLLWNEVKKGNEDILGYSYDLWHLEAKKVKEEYKNEVLRAIERSGVSQSFTWTGHRQDLREILSTCSVTLSLTKSPEAFGKSTLEALALGKPVAGYAHGGVKEQLDAFLPEGNVAVGNTAAMADLLARWHAQPPPLPRQIPSPYNMQDMIQAHLDVYQELTPYS